MNLHLTLASLLLAVCTAAGAEVSGAPGESTTSTGTGNWAGALEKPGTDSSTDLSKDLSPEARILNEHLATFDKPGQMPDAKKPDGLATTAAVDPAAPASGSGAIRKPVDINPSWFDKIRNFFRPVHKELVESEIAQAARELEVTGTRQRDAEPPAATPPPGYPRTRGPHDPQDEELAFEHFVNEVKPYFYGAIGLAVLGYLGLMGWRYLSWKKHRAARRTQRTRAAKRSRRSRKVHTGDRTQRAAGSPDQDADDGTEDGDIGDSQSAPLSTRGAPLASRAAPLRGGNQG